MIRRGKRRCVSAINTKQLEQTALSGSNSIRPDPNGNDGPIKWMFPLQHRYMKPCRDLGEHGRACISLERSGLWYAIARKARHASLPRRGSIGEFASIYPSWRYFWIETISWTTFILGFLAQKHLIGLLRSLFTKVSLFLPSCCLRVPPSPTTLAFNAAPSKALSLSLEMWRAHDVVR